MFRLRAALVPALPSPFFPMTPRRNITNISSRQLVYGELLGRRLTTVRYSSHSPYDCHRRYIVREVAFQVEWWKRYAVAPRQQHAATVVTTTDAVDYHLPPTSLPLARHASSRSSRCCGSAFARPRMRVRHRHVEAYPPPFSIVDIFSHRHTCRLLPLRTVAKSSARRSFAAYSTRVVGAPEQRASISTPCARNITIISSSSITRLQHFFDDASPSLPRRQILAGVATFLSPLTPSARQAGRRCAFVCAPGSEVLSLRRQRKARWRRQDYSYHYD